MKVIIFIGFLVTVTSGFTAEKQTFADPLGEIIENLLIGLIDQLKTYDPVDIAEHTISVSKYSVVFKNIHADGFSDIIPKVAVIIGLPIIEANVNVSLSKVSGSIETWESNLPLLYGKGTISADIENIEVSVYLKLNTAGSVEPSKVVVSIGNANVYITGIHNDEDLSKKLADLLNYLLNTFVNDGELDQILGRLLDQILESLLGGLTIR